MLIILTIGLFAYAIWRLFEGLAGLQIRSEAKLITKIVFRFPPVISALIYMFYGVAVILTLSDPGKFQLTSSLCDINYLTLQRMKIRLLGALNSQPQSLAA